LIEKQKEKEFNNLFEECLVDAANKFEMVKTVERIDTEGMAMGSVIEC
jgi:hypothetical protein